MEQIKSKQGTELNGMEELDGTNQNEDEKWKEREEKEVTYIPTENPIA